MHARRAASAGAAVHPASNAGVGEHGVGVWGPPDGVVEGLAYTRTGRAPGTAPAVLLLHGAGASRGTWAPMLADLAARYDVVALDLPGHGDSVPLAEGEDCRPAALARKVVAAVARLDLSAPHILANSLGGWIALDMAADGHAASVTGLAPAGLCLVPVPPGLVLRLNRRLALRTGRFADTLLRVGALRRAVFASGSARPGDIDPALARDAVRALRRSTGYEAVLAATAHHRFERRRDVTVPVTVVFGDRDWILPAWAHQHRALAPAGARWEVLPRCGHAPMWDAPGTCLRLLEETVVAAG
jgi:pimeloyl-ACP methyl ester carboxylesterase